MGINPCVKAPLYITDKLKATKGYISVKGKIEKHFFQQTLCLVKNEGYRLYVNGLMMKGVDVKVGQTANFVIEQDTLKRTKNIPMSKEFKKKLEEHNLLSMFQKLPPFRQKEILRYLNNLKTEEALTKNINKMIRVLKGKESSPLLRMKETDSKKHWHIIPHATAQRRSECEKLPHCVVAPLRNTMLTRRQNDEECPSLRSM